MTFVGAASYIDDVCRGWHSYQRLCGDELHGWADFNLGLYEHGHLRHLQTIDIGTRRGMEMHHQGLGRSATEPRGSEEAGRHSSVDEEMKAVM